MTRKNVELVVEKLLAEDTFRSAFQKNVEEALAASDLTLEPEEVQALLGRTGDDAEGLRGVIDGLEAARTHSSEVEVICACGKGYWAAS